MALAEEEEDEVEEEDTAPPAPEFERDREPVVEEAEVVVWSLMEESTAMIFTNSLTPPEHATESENSGTMVVASSKPRVS